MCSAAPAWIQLSYAAVHVLFLCFSPFWLLDPVRDVEFCHHYDRCHSAPVASAANTNVVAAHQEAVESDIQILTSTKAAEGLFPN